MERLVRFEFLEKNKSVYVEYREVYSKEDFSRNELMIKDSVSSAGILYDTYYSSIVEQISFDNCDAKDFF